MIDCTHQLVKAPIVLVWDRRNTHVSHAMRELIAEREWLTVFGDLNCPSHLDRPDVEWPATKAAEDTGFADSYPEAHPDPASGPGHTWSPVRPVHQYGSGRPEPQDRIDYVLHRGLTVRDARTLVTGTPRLWLDESGNLRATRRSARPSGGPGERRPGSGPGLRQVTIAIQVVMP